MSDVCLAVVIKEDVGVNAFKIQFDRIAPAFHRVFGFHNHVSHSP